ncbi:MAG: 2Fe-2S iron-sulfur cluster binding domain-containing protein, partial [Candidatus Latescibacteria bacterium]|nr:2Fe-2S iron-sulfur cluster binding domain-containing protein [Candidatus Latescibacterota bacterium]
MADTKKKLFKVDFLPNGLTGTVPSGSTIMEAAHDTGVYLNSVCGGEGLCGKCRVIVREGRVNMKPNSFLDREEIQKGYVIACLTEVLSDLSVEVPQETRLEGRPKFDADYARRFGPLEKGDSFFPHDPLCR